MRSFGFREFWFLSLLVTTKVPATDPIIRMLEGYAYHQAQAEILAVDYWVILHREYLSLSQEQINQIASTQPQLSTSRDQWRALEKLRDRHVEVLSFLSHNQRQKVKNLYYVELPTHTLLIVPSVQRYLYLDDAQKAEIEEIYMNMLAEIKLRLGSEHAAESEKSIRGEIHEDFGLRMWEILSEEQIERIDSRRRGIQKRS